jgi:hypothetical protein
VRGEYLSDLARRHIFAGVALDADQLLACIILDDLDAVSASLGL